MSHDGPSPSEPATRKLLIHAKRPLLDSNNTVPTIPQPEKEQHITAKLHEMLTGSDGQSVATTVEIDGDFKAVLYAASQEMHHGRPDEITRGTGQDALHLGDKEIPSHYDGMNKLDTTKLILDAQGALESQGGKSPRPNK